MNKPYNGHKNWTHWNVSLWISNEETLYRLALDYKRRYKSSRIAARKMIANEGLTKTPDGARYSIVALSAAIDDLE